MTTDELQKISDEELRIGAYPFTVRPLSPEEGGGYLIEYPDFTYCISDGETPEEAIRNGRDALRGVLLTKMEFGDAIPEPGSSKVVRLPPELGSRLNDQAQRRGVEPQTLAAEMISNALQEPAA